MSFAVGIGAGIAAGDNTSTGDYIGGVAPSAKIIALKVSDAAGSLYSDKILAAWDWCITHKDDDPATHDQQAFGRLFQLQGIGRVHDAWIIPGDEGQLGH